MDIVLLDNDSRTVREALEGTFVHATSAQVAVAFARSSGLDVLPGLERMASDGKPVRLLAGVHFQLTDLSALDRVSRPPAEARVYWSPDSPGDRVFHPKVYVIESRDDVTAVVGSSNFTAGGLQNNVEANLLIRGAREEPIISAIAGYHARLWQSPFSIPVTSDFRGRYERLQDRRHQVELQLRRDRDFEEARNELTLAIAEVTTASYAGREARAWLLITSPENYLYNIRGSIWGSESRRQISEARPGDLLFFYIKSPVMALGAMGIVTKGLYEDRSPYWPDRTYPWRFHFAKLIEPRHPVPFRPLVEQLDLFGRRADPHWGQGLQRSMIKLSGHDADVLRVALASAGRNAA